MALVLNNGPSSLQHLHTSIIRENAGGTQPDGLLKCRACTRTFSRPSLLSRHYNCSGHGPNQPVEKKIRPRHRYTFRRKRAILLELDALRASGIPFAQQVLSRRTGVSEGSISKWEKKRDEIFRYARTRRIGNLRAYIPSVGRYPDAELEVYTRFLWRRRYLRLRTSRQWLVDQMKEILLETRNITPEEFGCSNGWLCGFCKRWEITYQCRTNKHKRSVQERLPAIREFHRWLIYGLQRSGPRRCPKYGRFPPARMFHVDQVPVAFSSGSKRSMNVKGDACETKDFGGSGADKRMCSLQVTICAAPESQLMKLELILRGSGKRVADDEQALYDSLTNINVRWQKKAWADETYTLAYLESFRRATSHLGEVMLGMDRHGSQKTPVCLAFMKAFHIVPVFTPPNCTDCTSPVDRHVGQALKLKMQKRYFTTSSTDRDRWDLPKKEGGLSDKAKRMLVAQWASEAWEEFCRDNQRCIRSAFIKTGFLLAQDGSENGLIELWPKRKLKGAPRLFSSTGPDGRRYNFD